mgnify:CR=1 FL=1
MFPSTPRPVAPLPGAAPLSARCLLAGLLLLGAACGESGPTGTAESPSASAGGSQPTTPASTVEAGSGITTPAVTGSDAGPAVTPVADGGLPGERFDFEIPRSGDRLAVVGVAHDDVLNLRILPGADQPIVEKLAAAFKAAMQTPTVQNVVKSRYMKDVFIGPDKAGAARASPMRPSASATSPNSPSPRVPASCAKSGGTARGPLDPRATMARRRKAASGTSSPISTTIAPEVEWRCSTPAVKVGSGT